MAREPRPIGSSKPTRDKTRAKTKPKTDRTPAPALAPAAANGAPPPTANATGAVPGATHGDACGCAPCEARPSWDHYFIKLAMLASERATCPRMHCGCVIVRDRYVLATGYNGSLPGLPHCDDVGCLIVEGHCVRTNHAEMNALCQATRHGVPVVGATAYVTNMPCTNCAKALIAAGIARVVVFSDYHDTLAVQFFTEAGVQVARVSMPDLAIHYDLASYTSARKTEKSK